MPALNHGKIIKALEKSVGEPRDNFIYSFLKAYGTPKATVDRLKMGDRQRNVANRPGDVAVAQKLYFHRIEPGENPDEQMDAILADPVIERHRIRFVLVTDFQTALACDRKVDDRVEFDFADIKTHYEFFLPMTGQYEKAVLTSEHPADIKACEKMGRLYDTIREANHYEPEEMHTLNVFLTRLLFCFFAEDTGIFPVPNQLTNALASMTLEDGSDVADFFEQVFAVLDLPDDDRARQHYPKPLQAFPYVNGALFKEKGRIPRFTAKSRRLLLECGRMKWNEISPAIFGSMFQAVMDPEKRRSLGAHYTSERNILKLIRPLFLDDLEEEFQGIADMKSGKTKTQKLGEFRRKIARLGFLDPACGCGNFLIIAYRELRELDLKVLLALRREKKEDGQQVYNVAAVSGVSISRFYGIELLEFPVEVAKVSMWLMEHVMNLKFAEALGLAFPSIPLKDSAQIVCANALTTPWENVVAPKELDYIFGNPPFSGARLMTPENKSELLNIFAGIRNAGNLDYVCCWYKIAIDIMSKEKKIKSAYVSTNSISQGEQVSTLWKPYFSLGIHIDFAYRSFKWHNESRGKAGVHCVIIGFSFNNKQHNKFIVSEKGERFEVNNIGPYLTSSKSIFVENRTIPICNITQMRIGNMPIDGGYYLFSEEEMINFIAKEHNSKKYFRRWFGADEFINGKIRYCLYLGNCTKEELDQLPECKLRIQSVKNYRLSSRRQATRILADTPHKFNVENIQDKEYIIIPEVSSERRMYIPIGFMSPNNLVSNLVKVIPNATHYDFSILTSAMHMAWVRAICGRLKSDYRYSRDLCYNTFPWPNATKEQQNAVAKLGQAVLDARQRYFDMTLAQMYDPDDMPDDLRAAHHALDLAVDRLYRKKPFASEEERLELLFDLYAALIEEKGESPAAIGEEEDADA